MISEAWINKVTQGTVLKPSDRVALQDYADELVNCYETLQAMDMLSEIDNQKSLVSIVMQLPMFLQNRWKQKAHNISLIHRRTHIQDVVDFVKCAAEESNDPVFGHITDHNPVKPVNRPQPKAIGFSASTDSSKCPRTKYNVTSYLILVEN